jgi:hypothetical protein
MPHPVVKRRRRRLELLESTERHVPISFALIGAQKAATSTLYRMLVKHPEVVGGPEKEMRFFMREDVDWDDPDYGEYVRPAKRDTVHLAGDATPDYAIWPHAIERMHRYNPELRVLLSARDPIERAMSQWSMERDRNATFPDVPDAIAAYADDRLPDELPAGVKPWEFLRHTIFARGLYAQQVRRVLEVFPREQLLVLDFADVAKAPDATLDRMTDFLGLPRFDQHPKLGHKNQTRADHTGAPPEPADIGRLVDLYAGDLAEFAELSGLDLSRWSTNRVIAGELGLDEFTARLAAKLGLAGPSATQR